MNWSFTQKAATGSFGHEAGIRFWPQILCFRGKIRSFYLFEGMGSYSQIVESVKRVTDVMSEISAASLEQTSGIEQINQAIAQMDEVTQQNAALVEQAAAAASLQDQAGNLAKVVAVFKLDGAHSAGPAVAASVRRAPAAPARARTSGAAKPGRIAPVRIAPAIAKTEDWEEF